MPGLTFWPLTIQCQYSRSTFHTASCRHSAFRVEVQDKSIVFSSDQNGSDPSFANFAKDTSLLVMHMPIPEDSGDAAKQLHAVPSRIAEIATAANADRLVAQPLHGPQPEEL